MLLVGCKNSNPNRPIDGEKQLQDATENGDFTKVQQLLIAGVPADTRSPGLGWSPLHSAVAACGHSSIVKILLEHGAVPELKGTFSGTTPLHMAADGGNVTCIQLLLDKGADINCRNFVGFSPLHFAAREGRDDAIKLFLEASPMTAVVPRSCWQLARVKPKL